MRYNPSNNPLASRASPRTSTQEVGRNGTRPRPGRDRSSGPIPNPLTPLPLRPMNVPFEVTGGPNNKAGPRCLPTKCIPTTHQALGGWRKTQPPTPETQARGRASGRQKKGGILDSSGAGLADGPPALPSLGPEVNPATRRTDLSPGRPSTHATTQMGRLGSPYRRPQAPIRAPCIWTGVYSHVWGCRRKPRTIPWSVRPQGTTLSPGGCCPMGRGTHPGRSFSCGDNLCVTCARRYPARTRTGFSRIASSSHMQKMFQNVFRPEPRANLQAPLSMGGLATQRFHLGQINVVRA